MPTKKSTSKKVTAVSSIPQEVKDEMEAFDATFQKYSPKNKQEEKELRLAKLIVERERIIMMRMSEVDELKAKLHEFDLEKEVHENLMKENPKKREEWQYNMGQDLMAYERRQIAELEEWFAYDAAWVSAARGMIKSKKYQEISPDALSHFHFDGEGHSAWHDEISFPERAYDKCESKNCGCNINSEDIPF
ncbi:MAG: hypothetical protein Q7S48_03585 [bacterium]|nr:hypothetical protein [bacterium]